MTPTTPKECINDSEKNVNILFLYCFASFVSIRAPPTLLFLEILAHVYLHVDLRRKWHCKRNNHLEMITRTDFHS